jgi:hypothetical protein
VPLRGLEPPTNGLGNRCSIHLSYRGMFAPAAVAGQSEKLTVKSPMRERSAAFFPIVHAAGAAILLGLSVFGGPRLHAQVVASRSVATLFPTDSVRGFFARSSFFGELQRARHSTADDLAWTIRSGGAWDLYHGNNFVVRAAAAQEVVANPYTSLGFNPRGIVWEERLAAMRSTPRGHLSLALFHRCRHEIDNSDPPEQRVPQPGYTPAKRVVVLSGVEGGVAAATQINTRMHLHSMATVESYLAREDTRIPESNVAPRWTDATLSGTGMVRLDMRLSRASTAYLRLWSGGTLFRSPGNGSLRGNQRAEAGWRVTGRAGSTDLFMSAERTHDDLVSVEPRASRFISIGFRLAGNTYY